MYAVVVVAVIVALVVVVDWANLIAIAVTKQPMKIHFRTVVVQLLLV